MAVAVPAQVYNEVDEMGNVTQRTTGQRGFNPNSRDSVKQHKEVPRGLRVWTIDRRFGEVTPAQTDTMPHLFQNTIYNHGLYGEYNTIGSNFTPRLSRIVIDRPETSEFFFTQPYSYTTTEPDQFHFTNTLSPITNISYDNCGNKTNGEDHLRAKFAVNANKQFGMGFDIEYSYARGFFQNQSVSHLGARLYASYIGDRYQMHALFQKYHRKQAENGGITNDEYITHPESFDDQFSYEEIPTVLSSNWNRNNSTHFLLSHRYNFGFYRKVKMTDEEIKARQFAEASAKQRQQREREQASENGDEPEADDSPTERKPDRTMPSGRPDDAKIAGLVPTDMQQKPLAADTSRIAVIGKQQMDSLKAVQARNDSIDATMKREYVPVTSIIHTVDINSYKRIYHAYATPDDYYANTYYNDYDMLGYVGDSIYDKTRHLAVKNTVALALLEGFNKYAKAGLKAFVSYEYVNFQMPDVVENMPVYRLATWKGHNVSLGGQISKTQGHTLHYDLSLETCLTGMNAGALAVDFSTDLNFPLFGDTVRLAAKAAFHRITPTFFQEHYHSKHLWWDQGLSEETRTRIEGIFSYDKTKTQLRVAVEEIQNYTYFGTDYTVTEEGGRTGMTAGVYQHAGNINLITAQLKQDFRLGILNWDNIITYQNSSNKEVLPVPSVNIFTNLYLKFRLVKQLAVELGSSAFYFTKYYAPDYVPQLQQFAVQRTAESKVEIGGYPFIDVYANMHLKNARFFIMMSHVNKGSGSKMQFLAPHHPYNGSNVRIGVSWNFFN